MRNKTEGLCRIITKDGRQYLAMPSGEIVPKQVWSRVTDPVEPNQNAYAIIKVLVNLDDTVDANASEKKE